MGAASTLPKRKPAAKRRSRKKPATGWLAWWPLILGIAVTPFAIKAATLMALAGPDGLRLLYPWMLIPKLHFLALPEPIADAISQAMMYLQFPFYGLLTVFVLRSKGWLAALARLSLLHLVAIGLVFIAGRS